MKTEDIKNLDQKKDDVNKILDDLLDRVTKEEEVLKELQIRFRKQRKEIRKWLSLMG